MRLYHIFDNVVEVRYSDDSKIKLVDFGYKVFNAIFEVGEYRFDGGLNDYLVLVVDKHFEVDFFFGSIVE